MATSAGRTQNALRKRQVAKELWEHERTEFGHLGTLVGVDEAGRGCLAGPVYAAAVVLDGDYISWAGVADSKQLSRRQRERVYEEINARALAIGRGTASAREVDHLNVLQASMLAMSRALRDLSLFPDVALIDGPYVPAPNLTEFACVPVIHGDARCISIAAASIIAKVERDWLMDKLGSLYPKYGFENHAGYGTAAHLDALRRYGPCEEHRMTFAPVRALENTSGGA